MKQITLCILLATLIACNSQNPSALKVEDLYNYDIEEKIEELGIKLEIPGKPLANYVGAVKTGDLIFLSGKIPKDANGDLIKGKLGVDLTVDEGYKAARYCGIAQLATLKAEIGDLNKVVRIVKVTGMINSDPYFTDQSKVVNGFSDLMVEVFGERGKHARAAVGMASLPLGAACEIEMIVEVKQGKYTDEID
jgi:enamine deaminase RidA (YjgF/YER057c/UK114 family)